MLGGPSRAPQATTHGQHTPRTSHPDPSTTVAERHRAQVDGSARLAGHCSLPGLDPGGRGSLQPRSAWHQHELRLPRSAPGIPDCRGHLHHSSVGLGSHHCRDRQHVPDHAGRHRRRHDPRDGHRYRPALLELDRRSDSHRLHRNDPQRSSASRDRLHLRHRRRSAGIDHRRRCSGPRGLVLRVQQGRLVRVAVLGRGLLPVAVLDLVGLHRSPLRPSLAGACSG